MNTRALMTVSAAFMALLGLGASFLPQELLSFGGSSPRALPVLVVQVAGAIYLGFAFLNWMARGVLIGGIYARPVALGNFVHFAVVTIVLAKSLLADYAHYVLAAAVPYALLAVWFGLVLFNHPKQPDA